MTTRARAPRAPATERGIVRLAEQLVDLLGAVTVGVDGPEAEAVAAALGTGGLPAVVVDDNATYDVVVALGGGDGTTVDAARSFVSSVAARAGVAVVFTSQRGDERSAQWWDDLFAVCEFEVRDVLRAPLWDDSSWDAHGLTGLTLYRRVSEPARINEAAPPVIPRSALHPGVLATSRRADVRAYELIDRFELYDPAIEDPIETLGQALERHEGEAEDARRDADAAEAQWQETLDRVLTETRAMDARARMGGGRPGSCRSRIGPSRGRVGSAPAGDRRPGGRCPQSHRRRHRRWPGSSAVVPSRRRGADWRRVALERRTRWRLGSPVGPVSTRSAPWRCTDR